jgi:hypothetical protein
MKRTFQFAAFTMLAVITQSTFAQVTKINIVEHFTNTSCSVCAGTNPNIISTLGSHPAVLHVSFHPSSPYPSDFFNQQNMAENDARTNHYGIFGGTPRVVINGTAASTGTLNSTLTGLNSATSNFSINANYQYKGTDSIAAQVVIKKVATDTSLTAKLFVGAIEDTVFRTTNNGEAIHHNVFRKAMTTVTGDNVTLPAAVGDSIVFNYTIKADTSWKMNRMYSLAILQANDKKIINSVRGTKYVAAIPNAIQDIVKSHANLVFNATLHTLNFSESVENITVFDLNGKKIIESKSNTLRKIEIPASLNGVYLVNFKQNNIYYTQKIYFY